jgi:hypothetical protein
MEGWECMLIPKHYSLHSEGKDHFVIHDKRDNKTFKVAKKEMHPATQNKILRMQKFAEGGEAKDGSFANTLGNAARVAAVPSLIVPDPTMDQAKKFGEGVMNFGRGVVGLPPEEDDSVPPSESPSVAPQEIPHADMSVGTATVPALTQDPLKGTPYEKAFQLQETGIKGTTDAQAMQQQQIAKAEANYQQMMKDFNYTSSQEAWNKKVELDNLQEELVNQKVDPNRFWHTAGTGSKIAAGIALALGGIGAGLTHGPNQALQMIDKLTERDIEAQKTNIGQKNNLFNMNLRRYQDQQMADHATRLQMNEALQSQIRLSAAKSGSMQAQAQGQLLLGQLEQNKAQLLNQFGIAAAKNKVLGAATGEGGIPVTQEHPMLLQDKDYVGKRVVVNDKAYQASSEKGAEDLRSSAAMLEPIERDINKLRQMGSSALTDPKLYQEAQGIVGRLSMNVNEFNGYKRFTDVDDKVIQKQFNNPATLKSLLAGDESNIDTLKALRGKMQSEYKQKLVNYKEGQAQGYAPSSMAKLPLNK